ncbi:Cytochrome c oxidase subunit 3 [Pseudomonas fluorescens]|uniref:Cytochrome c oxidase subunit 3 n=1 Tax=Pseudomonas fluorescens TaxID=294 RepID=A0A8H2NU18_PSEFL|nr:cytochrome c oxidase subunit 3 [Pseudomonas fluorescens]VVP21359.1 Cytochrome c oxidase subunit 3 [Pseudomonas fluorescens]
MNMHATNAAAIAARGTAASHVPGENSLWLLIFGDMVIYAIMFLVFAYSYQQQPDTFAAGQELLNKSFGFINTLLLLTSSWFVAKGVRSIRRQPKLDASHWLLLALVCGGAFVVSKVVEYSLKINAGVVLTSNDFFMYYYMITAFHLIHVLIGMTVLVFMWRTARRPQVPAVGIRFLESGATFWHLVDLLWIMIFPLIYLLGRT